MILSEFPILMVFDFQCILADVTWIPRVMGQFMKFLVLCNLLFPLFVNNLCFSVYPYAHTHVFVGVCVLLAELTNENIQRCLECREMCSYALLVRI